MTLIGEAVFARCLSAMKDERVKASGLLAGPKTVTFAGDKKAFINDIKKVAFFSQFSLFLLFLWFLLFLLFLLFCRFFFFLIFSLVAGLVRLQDHLLCAGVHVDEGGSGH